MSTEVMVACVPRAEVSASQIVHLYVPEYLPTTRKSQPRDRKVWDDDFVWQHSMCNVVAVNELHPGGRSNPEPHPWKYEHLTISEARQKIASAGYLRWCRWCIGHAAERENLLGTIVGLIIDRQVRLDGE